MSPILGIECPRCRGTFPMVRELAAHLVQDHLIGAARAQQEAAKARSSPVANIIPSAPPEEHHACPKCGTVVTCDLAALFTVERQAQRLRILAGMWRARLGGVTIGRPRRNTFDVTTARRLVAGGLTYQAVAEALGASSPSAIKSALARERRKA